MMKEIRRKINFPSLCMGRKTSRRTHGNVLECLYRRSGKHEAMEAWPTSPVLSEEKNTKEKKKAHKYYERQLKACSWYSKVPRPSWIEIAQPFDNNSDTCPQCYYEEPCGCVIVSYQPVSEGGRHGSPQRRPTVVSVRSSLGDTQRVESRTSTEDNMSYYDNLCDFCKVTSLERRTQKYSEWRRGSNAKVVVEDRAPGPTAMCTCAMDHLSFIEWKQLYEQRELVTFSKADHDHERADLLSSTSDYGTQKSKADSESTIAFREYPAISLTVKTPSLGYNSSCSIPNTEQELHSDQSSSLPMILSDSEVSNNEEDVRERPARTPHAFHGFRGKYGSPLSDDDDELLGDKLNWIHPKDTALIQTPNSKHKPKSAKNKTSNSEGKKTRSRRPRAIHEGWLDTINAPEDTTAFHPELSTLCSEGEAARLEDDGSQVPSKCVPVQTDGDIPPKIATENDETLPVDFLSEFLLVAKSIDEFYESIYAKKFLENRVGSTAKCDSVGDTIGKTRETFSQELQKSIRSLEKVCCFVEQSDGEDASVRGISPNGGKRLSSIDCNDGPVWRLSQQSLDLMHARRSRSTSSGSSSNRSRCSTNGSRSPNSRCSNAQQKDHAKFSETSTLDLRSPDSGFSEKASLLSQGDSPDACRLGTKWAGSMQWDYTDWYFFGYDCKDADKAAAEVKEQNLTTIQEAPQAVPQDPLDWDW